MNPTDRDKELASLFNDFLVRDDYPSLEPHLLHQLAMGINQARREGFKKGQEYEKTWLS